MPAKVESRRAEVAERVVAISQGLSRKVSRLRFGGKVAYIYNPLSYARAAHEQYLQKYGGRTGVALLLGMNPGPWGMVQTGVPFGEIAAVRDWMKIDSGVTPPRKMHPKRPIQGFTCSRSEVSGARLWGWAAERFSTPNEFFRKFFVWNYCPLSFMIDSGANLTPDKLPADERAPLFAKCDDALRELVSVIEPRMVIGIGKFAEARARAAVPGEMQFGTVLHPSPASPAANRGWAAQAERQLAELGLLD